MPTSCRRRSWSSIEKGIFTFANTTGLETFGYTREDLAKGVNVLETIVPEDRDRALENIGKRLRGETTSGNEYTMLRRDGSTFPAVVHASPIVLDGKILGLRSIVVDITDLKRAEAEKILLESQLRQSRKMEAIGNLAGGVAHDFNNILTAIIGFSSVLKMEMSEDDPRMAYVDQILGASERAANLTQSLLVFSHKQPMDLKPHNINELVKGTTKLLERLLTEDIELKVNLSLKNPTIMADSTQIGQVLINLVANARDAMLKGGALTIETNMAILDDQFLRTHGYGLPGEYVMLSVSDTGVGMDEKTKEQIFEPFFTTKDAGKGTGLGLSTVYGIVKQHKGYVTVLSEPGQGAAFLVYFPFAVAEEKVKCPESLSAMGGTETVLVAEDDPGVRRLVTEVLQRCGYTTIEATDGEEAVRIFTENIGTVDLIIMDVVMPKKNGKDVFEEIKGICPNIKVLFTSGYTSEVMNDKGIEDNTVDFIKKPIMPMEFLVKVREVLDREISAHRP